MSLCNGRVIFLMRPRSGPLPYAAITYRLTVANATTIAPLCARLFYPVLPFSLMDDVSHYLTILVTLPGACTTKTCV
jgi:hypothetical protein